MEGLIPSQDAWRFKLKEETMKTQRLTMEQAVVEFPKNLYSATVHRTSPKPVVKAIYPEVEDSKNLF